MKALITKTSLLICMFSLLSFNALAKEERVFKNGEYWEVSAISIVDGQWYNYATHLSNKWRDSMEFAKSKGWINDYKVIVNEYPRKDEPDMYLITIFDEMADRIQEEERYQAWKKWSKDTLAERAKGFGDRVVMRHLTGDTLLRELTFR